MKNQPAGRLLLKFILTIVPLLTGCFPSVNPICSDDEIIFDPALLGIYADPRYKENFTIVERLEDPRFYRVIQKEGRAEYRMVGRLVKLGEQHFMDLRPEEPLQVDVPGGPPGVMDLFRSATWLPVHIFVKVSPMPDKSGFKYWAMDEKGLAYVTNKEPAALKLTRGGLIVSSTAELQAFLRKYGNDKLAFTVEGFLTNRIAKLPRELEVGEHTRLPSGGFFRPATNGEAAHIDLRTTTLTWPGQGDLIVQCWVSAKEPKDWPPFDWKCRLSVPGGGLIEFTNVLEVLAPEAGYRPFDEIDMPASLGKKWRHGMSKNYFVKLADGKYGRIEVTFTPSNRQPLRILSVVNNSGERHLDGGHRKQQIFE